MRVQSFCMGSFCMKERKKECGGGGGGGLKLRLDGIKFVCLVMSCLLLFILGGQWVGYIAITSFNAIMIVYNRLLTTMV